MSTATLASPAPVPDDVPARCDVLGVRVSAIDIPVAVGIIGRWIARRERHYVTVTGVHGVMESRRDPELRAIHNRAGLVTPDGMPLVWLARLAGHRSADRVYGPDLMLAVLDAGRAHGWRSYFYGGGEGVAQKLADRLGVRFPGMSVAGMYCPPFRPLSDDEKRAVADRINAASPDIVWVGLSTPKQERWMAEMRPLLDAPVLVGVGAAFDFHAGLKRQAPRWVQRSGMEWLYRMVHEPRRLWKRYLRNNPLFIGCVLLSALRLRDFRDDPAASA